MRSRLGTMTIADIQIATLSRITTEGGDVMHAMKRGDKGYSGFGEAYFSWVNPGSVKAWKRHLQMTMNLVVPFGMVKFVFCTLGSGGIQEIRTETIGETRYLRITVPPGIWFGFQGLGDSPSLVLNLANILHDPDEVERMTVSGVDFIWN